MEPLRQENRGRYVQIEDEIRYNTTSHWISHQDEKTWHALSRVHSYTRCEKCQIGVYMQNVSKHITKIVSEMMSVTYMLDFLSIPLILSFISLSCVSQQNTGFWFGCSGLSLFIKSQTPFFFFTSK